MAKPPSPISSLWLLLILSATSLPAQTTLEKSLDDISRSIQGDVGVTIIDLQSKETLSLNGSNHFPMQSVFKFHIALAVLHLVDQDKLSPDQKYRVTKDHYFKTWSVLMRSFPEANMSVTLKELITLTVMNSDNVACDMLLDILGGPDKVHDFIKDLGITDIAIVASEREMHQDWDVQFSILPSAPPRKEQIRWKEKSKTGCAFRTLKKLSRSTRNSKRLKSIPIAPHLMRSRRMISI